MKSADRRKGKGYTRPRATNRQQPRKSKREAPRHADKYADQRGAKQSQVNDACARPSRRDRLARWLVEAFLGAQAGGSHGSA